MAETFLFNIAENVLGKLGSLAVQEACLAWGVETELEKLKSTISTIRAVLLDAEEQQENKYQLTDWLGKIKDALYDADDVLDEFHCEASRSQVVNRGGIGRKVRHFFSGSNSLVFRFKMSHKIKEIRQKLDEIAAEKAKFHLMERFADSRVMPQRETHSFVYAPDVIGRDNDKENIVQLLMNPSDGGNVSIIPIVGIGGLGKTTLAKLVYNDERVVRHFELKMWVYVSEKFEIKKLASEILKSATGTKYDDLSIDQLQASLRSTLNNKTFLLVLDDVWNSDRGKWIELKNLLIGGANGSKIVVSTRSQSVASVMGTISAYNLEGLSDKDCLSLLVKWAFREGEEAQYPNLLKIGVKIVKKCGGLPLAVRTLGSLLYLKTEEQDWLFIKNNEIWKFEQEEDDILPALRLSYNEMPSYLKQCFIYCSIFPKGYEFDEKELIQFWMAEGLLQSSYENQELNDIGERYLKELSSRSFFQNTEPCFPIMIFKMHDLVHDLALSMAQTECLNINFQTCSISKRVRHVSFSGEGVAGEEIPSCLLELNKVRTILFLDYEVGPTRQSFVETCISKFKYMRVLDLRGSYFEVLPNSIGNLKHLRYLNISGNPVIKKLPNSTCKLQSLQSLHFAGCKELEELPRDIGNLINLQSLRITTKQVLLPEGIGRLNSLRLLGFDRCGNLLSLGDGIQHLTSLQTLGIVSCGSLECLPPKMKYLNALKNLIIINCEKLTLIEWEKDIQDLRCSLRSLAIYKLPQLVVLPQWLQLSANTLQYICITECPNLTALPEWLKNLTSLQHLMIGYCPQLSTLPEGMHHLTALKRLVIEDCPQLMRRCKRETGEDWPKIAHVPKIILIEESSDKEEAIESSFK